MRFGIASAFALMALLAAAIAPAGVGAQDISLDVVGVVFGDEGDVFDVINEPVDPELVGDTCVETVTTGNNASTHPNNDLLITTGGVTYVIPDVEAGPNDISTIEGDVVLGENIVVQLRLGPDGASSGGVRITFECTDTQIPEVDPEPPTPEEPDFTG